MVMSALESNVQRKSRRQSVVQSSLPSSQLSPSAEDIGVPISVTHTPYLQKSAERSVPSCADSFLRPAVLVSSPPPLRSVFFNSLVSPIAIHNRRVQLQPWVTS